MNKLYILLVLICFTFSSKAADSLFINIEQHVLKNNDTLYFNCNYKFENPKLSKITLNVIIENLDKTKNWKFRYPLMDGYNESSLVVGKDIPAGKYAITFLLQQNFLNVKGQVKDFNPTKSKGINYLLLSKQKDAYLDFIKPDALGYFTTPKMIFEDTAKIVFSEIGKKNQNLFINLSTYLDSAYTPIAKHTEFISIGAQNKEDSVITSIPYDFDYKNYNSFTLNEVVVKSTMKKKVDQYNETYSTGLFTFGSPQIFDGIEGNQIGYAPDIFSFLQGRVAGLRVDRDPFGSANLRWREGNVDVYLDEFKVSNEMAAYVNTNDIAMVKVFAPMSGGPTGNGCIAIYTKRGIYYDERSSRKYNFQVLGYTPQLSVWK